MFNEFTELLPTNGKKVPFIRKMLHEIFADSRTRNVFYFLCINLSFAVVEATYGVISNSLGLTSDSIHMFFDSSAIVFGLAASVVAKRESTPRFTFGFGRIEVLAGFVNAIALILATCGIVLEAIERIFQPVEIMKENILLVSVMGLIVNVIGIFCFEHGHMHGAESHSCSHQHSHGHDSHSHEHHHHHSHSSKDIIMQGMFLHVLADAFGSVSVIISSILIQLFGWTWIDPVCSLLISALIFISSYPLVKSCCMILLQRIPHSSEHRINELSEKVTLPELARYSYINRFE
jgi:zinc transporter 5/7